MAAYEFTALNAKGKQERGTLEADSARQVRQLLREKKLTPLTVEVASQQERKAKGGVVFLREAFLHQHSHCLFVN
ncbi:hypothetical protein [Zooshikella ganghwensis]|uniref:hypothetical protein n=1 Tax=Zooshikella ganghwensis TaxID=202772 RepID=UPI0023EE0005|nr:hypothetical protein [Zooshikella ganghwensis]